MSTYLSALSSALHTVNWKTVGEAYLNWGFFDSIQYTLRDLTGYVPPRETFAHLSRLCLTSSIGGRCWRPLLLQTATSSARLSPYRNILDKANLISTVSDGALASLFWVCDKTGVPQTEKNITQATLALVLPGALQILECVAFLFGDYQVNRKRFYTTLGLAGTQVVCKLYFPKAEELLLHSLGTIRLFTTESRFEQGLLIVGKLAWIWRHLPKPKPKQASQ